MASRDDREQGGVVAEGVLDAERRALPAFQPQLFPQARVPSSDSKENELSVLNGIILPRSVMTGNCQARRQQGGAVHG